MSDGRFKEDFQTMRFERCWLGMLQNDRDVSCLTVRDRLGYTGYCCSAGLSVHGAWVSSGQR